ncbi:hypothetical protein [Paenibacillus ihuae]|uniref:hypothetical protein n=1 Tax=Paenibacillus ihuae TaxID=1232431 RepID=UPI0006D53649|nr:hypothetical protein [Paenibacillus ihuae]
MKLNGLFLLIGLILSVISKLYHFKFKDQAHIGNMIVIPAAVSFCLAILYSLPKFNRMVESAQWKAFLTAASACGAVVSFQLMMILLMGDKNTNGLYWLLPFILLLGIFFKLWSK